MYRAILTTRFTLAAMTLFTVGIMNEAANAGHAQTTPPRTGAASATAQGAADFPELPVAITSFGAAVSGDNVYVYGGNMGSAHEYSRLGQSNQLLRMNVQKRGGWDALPEGPRLQGLAMVAYDGALYRVGGFAARNEAGQPNDLWSTDSFARFNIQDNSWEDLPALPEPRSSHDAALLGSKLYVVGGWTLHGGDASKWHETAYCMDLATDKPEWAALPAPPFQRRALSMAGARGKMYVIGGMEPKGITTAVAVYDPQTKTWSEGPALPGEGMEGFGSSAYAVGDDLFVSTYGGNVYKLNAAGDAWTKLGSLTTGRFFHRMVAADGELLFVGGANMDIGRFNTVDSMSLGDEE